MADEVDIANDAIMADMDRRIALQRAAANRPPVTDCQECEEPITQARQALRLQLCLDCARRRERASRLFRRD
jgi:formylmethanofuran dehydrogenase subunit E